MFPDPDAQFGARVVASLDTSGEMPALRLTWSPSDLSGATYAVRRRDDEGWVSIASGISEATCLDATAEPNVEYEYEITATLSDTSTASKSHAPASERKVEFLHVAAGNMVRYARNRENWQNAGNLVTFRCAACRQGEDGESGAVGKAGVKCRSAS